MKIHIHITLKPGVLDPQGAAIGQALAGLGFAGVNSVRQGKFVEIDLAETDPDQARATAQRMCEGLLANIVIENYAIDLA